MKIKVFTDEQGFKIINVLVSDTLRTITNKYHRWEYVL